jgi:hypothetical protein
MRPCIKRQKVVKRSEGLTVFRCLSKASGLRGQEVDEGVCSRCPVRLERHESPCRSVNRTSPSAAVSEPPVTYQEMIDVSDAEIMEMIRSAGLDPADMEKAVPVEPGQLPPDYPPLTIQAWNYKEALIRWSKAGRPTRTQEEVKRLHSTYCAKEGEPCDWYDPEQKRCRGCGCKVTVGSVAIFNKLKMATEHCPQGKF